MNKRDYWMESYTGRRLYPLDPRPEDFCLADVAHSLALKCRFSGHCSTFWSVASHSVIVSNVVPERLVRRSLLHDAHEIVTGDMSRPLKQALKALGFPIGDIERGIDAAIDERFDLPPASDEDRKIISDADSRVLLAEARMLMRSRGEGWNVPEQLKAVGAPDDRILTMLYAIPSEWRASEQCFLNQARELGIKD